MKEDDYGHNSRPSNTFLKPTKKTNILRRSEQGFYSNLETQASQAKIDKYESSHKGSRDFKMLSKKNGGNSSLGKIFKEEDNFTTRYLSIHP